MVDPRTPEPAQEAAHRRAKASAFSRRLDLALEAWGLSNADLAAAISPDNGGQAVYAWRQRGGMSPESREKLRAIFPGLSLDWLLDGVGPMRLATGAMNASEEHDVAAVAIKVREPRAEYLTPIVAWDRPEDLPAETTVLLKKLDFYLSAGHGGPDPDAAEHTDKVLPFRADFCATQGWSARTHYTMRCDGESMEPTIQHGAPVVIATNERTIRSGKVFAILLDNEPLLKRLDRLPGGKVRVRSDNPAPAYEAFTVDEGEVQVIGRAVWTPVML